MSNDKIKCPQCGGAVSVDGRARICNECGYIYIPRDTAQTGYEQQQMSGYRDMFKESAKRRLIKKVVGVMIVPVVAIIIGVVFSVFSFCESMVENFREALEDIQPIDSVLSEVNQYIWDDATPINDAEGTVIEEIVWYAFAKEITEVTRDELESVDTIYFEEYDGNSYRVGYNLTDGESGDFLTAYDELPLEYLSCFPCLTTIDLYHGEIRDDSLRKLKELSGITGYFCKDLNEACNPETIRFLDYAGDSGVIKEDSFDNFTSLESLRLDCENVTNLNGLASQKHLTHLSIMNADNVSDFSFLYEMEGLEYLYIQSSQLKDIGFVANMPNLVDFGIEGTAVTSIDVIEPYKEQFETLSLIDNEELTSYDLVSDMVNLCMLDLTCNGDDSDYVKAIPDMSKLTELFYLSLEGYNDFTSLEQLDQLESLFLKTSGPCTIPQIRELPKLQELYWNDSIISSEALEDIVANETIGYLDFENSDIADDISIIFNMSGLSTLNLNNVICGIDFEKLEENISLSSLSMGETGLYALRTQTQDGFDMNLPYALDEHTDMFIKYPHLKYLSIPSQNITSIEFVMELQELQVLDIENNNVIDSTPAWDLPNCYVYEDGNPSAGY